jgi:hypothetical protein
MSEMTHNIELRTSEFAQFLKQISICNHPAGIPGQHPRADPDFSDPGQQGDLSNDIHQQSAGKSEWITTRKEYIPNFGMIADVFQAITDIGGILTCAFFKKQSFAETVATVSCTLVAYKKQNSVRILMLHSGKNIVVLLSAWIKASA